MLLFAPRRHRSLARSSSLWVPVLIAAILVFVPRVGHALERYPGDLKDELALGCTPTCLTCHTVLTGGAEFLNPFGAAMKSQGLSGDVGVHRVFQEGGSASMTDFDMDSVSDRQEIIDNTDPGSPDNDPICSDAVYGCGARVAPHAPNPKSGWAIGLALGVALLLWRQRRSV